MKNAVDLSDTDEAFYNNIDLLISIIKDSIGDYKTAMDMFNDKYHENYESIICSIRESFEIILRKLNESLVLCLTTDESNGDYYTNVFIEEITRNREVIQKEANFIGKSLSMI